MATGTLDLGLIHVSGDPVDEAGVVVRIHRFKDNKEILRFKNLSFPPSRPLAVTAFPDQEKLYVRIITDRFRMRTSGIFTVMPGETIARNLTMFRRPDRWNADFVAWDFLPVAFSKLKKMLGKSPSLRVRGGKLIGTFTGAVYDQKPDPALTLAKATLLNLYFKLSDLTEPVSGNSLPWFSFVKEILSIGRERLIAAVDRGLYDIVTQVIAGKGKDEYKKSPAGEHTGNFDNLGYAVTKSGMISIKSREDLGNLQVTLAKATDGSGNPALLMDSDIDEHGELLCHLSDVFMHNFNGGTHPYDIHEFLMLKHRQPLGYTLV